MISEKALAIPASFPLLLKGSLISWKDFRIPERFFPYSLEMRPTAIGNKKSSSGSCFRKLSTRYLAANLIKNALNKTPESKILWCTSCKSYFPYFTHISSCASPNPNNNNLKPFSRKLRANCSYKKSLWINLWQSLFIDIQCNKNFGRLRTRPAHSRDPVKT